MAVIIIIVLVLIFIAYKVFSNIETDEPRNNKSRISKRKSSEPDQIKIDKSIQTKHINDLASHFYLFDAQIPDLTYLHFDKVPTKTVELSDDDKFFGDMDTPFWNLYDSTADTSNLIDHKFVDEYYDDTYNTGTSFYLREILLLVWFGRVKSGRKTTVNIPKYFKNRYDLNVNYLIKRFIRDDLLIEKDGKYRLTESARKLANEYADVWLVHRNNVNLDQVYPRWNEQQFNTLMNKVNVLSDKLEFLHYLKTYDYCLNHPEIFSKKSNYHKELNALKQEMKEQFPDIIKANADTHDISHV